MNQTIPIVQFPYIIAPTNYNTRKHSSDHQSTINTDLKQLN